MWEKESAPGSRRVVSRAENSCLLAGAFFVEVMLQRPPIKVHPSFCQLFRIFGWNPRLHQRHFRSIACLIKNKLQDRWGRARRPFLRLPFLDNPLTFLQIQIYAKGISVQPGKGISDSW